MKIIVFSPIQIPIHVFYYIDSQKSFTELTLKKVKQYISSMSFSLSYSFV